MTRWVRNGNGILIPKREAGFIQPGIGLLNKKKSSGGGDPYWNNVVSLLHFNGVDGSTTITDEVGKSAWSIVGTGGAISTAQAPFGGSSLRLGGSAYVRAATPSAIDFIGGDYTEECIVRLDSLSNYMTFFAGWSGFASLALRLFAGASGQFFVNYTTNNNIASASGVVVSQQWQHFAATLQGTTLRSFVGGILVASGTIGTQVHSNMIVDIGQNDQNSGWRTVGYIAEQRITKGVARYTTNFPPPTAPFPNHA